MNKKTGIPVQDLAPEIVFRSRLPGCRLEGGGRLARPGTKPAAATPLVSVVTITFNSEKTIERTIQSVLAQTYGNIEYIIADGGSSDSTVELIKKYQHRIDYWCSSPDEGIPDAFNRGLSFCSGRAAGILNSDDWYEPGAVAAAAEAFAKDEKLAVFYGTPRYWDGERSSFTLEPDHLKLPTGMTISHPACFVSMRAYRAMGGFGKRYRCAMDYDFLLRLFYNDFKFDRTAAVLTNISLSGVSDKRWLRGLVESAGCRKRYQGFLPVYAALVFQIVKKSASILLEKAGLFSLVIAYRTKLAVIKKTYVGHDKAGRHKRL